MSAYAEFFLSSRSSQVELELLEISHPSFSQVYRIVRNATEGVTVTLETDEEAEFIYYPLQVERLAARDDLEFGLRVTLGDLGEIIPNEIDSVINDGTTATPPQVIYRTYRDDVLTEPLFGPLYLEINAFAFNREGSTFQAVAPSVALHQTGDLYTLQRFPMMRGFL